VPEAQLSFVEKPGMKWVDIPETTDKKGLDLCTTIGKQGGWCTQGGALAEDYGSGDNRLTALLDAEGRPHAQAKMVLKSYDQKKMRDMDEDEYVGDQMHKNIALIVKEKGFDKQIQKEAQEYFLSGGRPYSFPKELEDIWPSIEKEALARIPKKELVAPDITELKPVGNYFDSKQALEYERRDPNYKGVIQQSVLDFLNKGNWGIVKDLDHYDIIDAKDPSAVRSFVNDNYGGDFGMVDSSTAQKDFIKNYNGERFIRSDRFGDLIDNYVPRTDSYKAGGLVRMKDGGGVSAVESGDPSMQFYSRTMDNPDNSKTTEQGIVKQFEQDYMRFALQRHEQPKRQDIPNPPAPASRTNVYGEYGTPAMGGMVSGRLTKMNDQPDAYMGDLAYRTNIGPGMAHVGVQGMRTPQMPAQVTNYNAGYNVPLGNNGFAGVNVMQPAQGGKPVLGAQFQYRRPFAKGGAVTSLENNLPKLQNTDYKSIDELMTEISKRHKTAPKKLHDDFVEKHRMTPDNWIKRK